MIITRAAIMFEDGSVVEGHNYGAITVIANKLGFNRGFNCYGFVTSSDNFVFPTEAADIALAAGQIKTPIDELNPEDLWPEDAVTE